jgi:uncharacterized Tic20 family protein
MSEELNPLTPKNETKETIKFLEIIHLASNLLSGGFLGVICIGLYLLMNKDIASEVKTVCYDIINFNLSFIIYFIVGFVSLLLLIGFILLPVVYGTWLILMIL